eukprot:971091_1
MESMETFDVGDIVTIHKHKTRPDLNLRNCQITGGIIEFNHAQYYPVALKDEPDEIFNVKISYLTKRRPSIITPDPDAQDRDRQSSSCETPQHHDTGMALETGSGTDHNVPVAEILRDIQSLNKEQLPDESFMISHSYHPKFCQKYCNVCAKQYTCSAAFAILFCCVWHIIACAGIGIGISLIVQSTELSTATKDDCLLISYEERACQYSCNCTANDGNCQTCFGLQYRYFTVADKCNNATLEGAFTDLDCPQTLLSINAIQTCYIKACQEYTFSPDESEKLNDMDRMMVPIGISVMAVSVLVLLAPCCCYQFKNRNDNEMDEDEEDR